MALRARRGDREYMSEDLNPQEETFGPDDPREWLRMARGDLILAEAEIEGVDFELRAFHAQQAAEKAIKAVCIARGVLFPYTHKLDHLLAVLAADGVDTGAAEGAEQLNGFAASTRYPAHSRLDRAAFDAALSRARRVVAWATSHASRGPGPVREMPRHVYEVAAVIGAVPDPALLEEVVMRIVDAVAPDRIILFGSAARGTMGPRSDLDLLVVTSQRDDSGEADAAIRRALRTVQVEYDLVIATPGDLERYGRSIGLVYRAALEEGRELYRST
jgi:HEPN domain-containing protein/predicted nucleotidyltransferase